MYDSFNILVLIREIYSKSMSKIEVNLADSGLTHQQIMVLKFVAHNKEINISQLCEKMNLSKGTVSGIVNRLENSNYIKKVKHNNDKRNTYIQFGEKGLDFAKKFKIKNEQIFDNIFENLNKEEINQVIEALNLIKNKLK